MGTARRRRRALTTRWASAGRGCTSGSSRPALAVAWSARRAARRASTSGSWSRATPASAPRSRGATCSARAAGRRPTRNGRVGGPTVNFVTDGIEAALSRACEAAGGADVRLGGGVATIQQYLRARLIDELHVAIVPIFLGGGERLFDGLDGGPVGYGNVEMVGSASVTHVRFVRQ